MGSGVADAFIARAFPASPGSEFAISYTTAGADQFAVSFNGFVIRFCVTNSNCPSESAGLAATLLHAVACFVIAALTSTCRHDPIVRAGNNFCAVAICVNAELFGAVIKAITDAYNEVSLPLRAQLDTCLRLVSSPALRVVGGLVRWCLPHGCC